MADLRDLLMNLSEEVRKEYRVVLRDHQIFYELSHKEIAKKRKIAVGWRACSSREAWMP